MEAEVAGREKSQTGSGDWLSNRREFLKGVAALGFVSWADPEILWGAAETAGWSGLPARPTAGLSRRLTAWTRRWLSAGVPDWLSAWPTAWLGGWSSGGLVGGS